MKHFSRLLSILSLIYLFSCSSHRQNQPVPATLQGPEINDFLYDSNFPVKPTHNDLNQILESVKMVSNLSFYESYEFPFSANITLKEIRESNQYIERALRRIIFESPVSGTATVVSQDGRKVALLTCNHVVSSPDTLITFFEDNLGIKTSIISNFAVKTKETNNVIFLPAQRRVKVIASDITNDLALIAVELEEYPPLPLPVFGYKLGNAAELDWGTFVYIIGYPYGKKLVSSGLVSSPNRDKKHSFIVDATMHRGISGGIILALRDGPPNFELIGIATSISGEREFVLRPDPSMHERDFQFTQPYKGEIYIDTQVRINYGITFAVSTETVKNFILKNKKTIEEEGLSLDRFYN